MGPFSLATLLEVDGEDSRMLTMAVSRIGFLHPRLADGLPPTLVDTCELDDPAEALEALVGAVGGRGAQRKVSAGWHPRPIGSASPGDIISLGPRGFLHRYLSLEDQVWVLGQFGGAIGLAAEFDQTEAEDLVLAALGFRAPSRPVGLYSLCRDLHQMTPDAAFRAFERHYTRVLASYIHLFREDAPAAVDLFRDETGDFLAARALRPRDAKTGGTLDCAR